MPESGIESAGQKVRKGLRIAVGLLIRANRIWVQQRPASVHLAHLWEFPGGKLEESESPLQAVLRELHEEVGLELSGANVRLFWVLSHTYPTRHVTLFFFLTFLPHGLNPGGSGHWCDLADLSSYSFPPANLPVLEWLARAPTNCGSR